LGRYLSPFLRIPTPLCSKLSLAFTLNSELNFSELKNIPFLSIWVYNTPMWVCHACAKEVKFQGGVSRQEICPHCRSDLHCCLNCTLYDEYAHNHCQEPSAEWVSAREKNNFCEFFAFKDSSGAGRSRRERDEALAKLEALFKKKTS